MPIVSISKDGFLDFLPNLKEIELLPSITKVSPEKFGSNGAKLDIEGNGFRPDFKISIAGSNCHILEI